MFKWPILVLSGYGNQKLMVLFLKRDKLRDSNINQLKLEVHDTYRKDEKISTNFEPIDNTDVINKGYLDENLLKINGHLIKLE